MHSIAYIFISVLSFVVIALGLAIFLGGPVKPPPLRSVNDPFKFVDLLGLPPLVQFEARDGTKLAYRTYGVGRGGVKGSIVLIHGSSASSNSMHTIAKGFELKSYVVYSLDIRGHGESGNRGQIAYIGQLEDDIEDFMKCSRPVGKKVLVGFSAGGGFALRFAADVRRSLFDGVVLLSPFLSQSASTYRSSGGGWVSVGIPRIVGLLMLNRIGISCLNRLPVTCYALSPEAEKLLTPSYSYSLAMNYRPHWDYQSDITSATLPLEVVVGEDDEMFYADRFATEFNSLGRAIQVSIVPQTGHIDLTLSTNAIEAAALAVARVS